MLFPPFQIVLQEDVQEFHPYIFQIFAQLLEQRTPGEALPPAYLALFPPLLSPLFWERPGNTPALVRLVRAYLTVAPAEVVSGGHLPAVLGVFQKLIASKALDHEGFALLEALYVERGGLPAETLAPYTPHVWLLLLQRLQGARTAKYARGFVGFAAGFAAAHGGPALLAALDGVQAGLGLQIVQSVLAPSLGATSGGQWEAKLVVVGASNLVCATPALRAPEAAAAAGKLLDALLSLLTGSTSAAPSGDDEGAADEEGAAAGYSAAFAKLFNAQRAEPDPLPAVKDASAYLATSLGQLAAASPGALPALAAGHLSPEGQQRLQALCAKCGVTIA